MSGPPFLVPRIRRTPTRVRHRAGAMLATAVTAIASSFHAATAAQFWLSQAGNVSFGSAPPAAGPNVVVANHGINQTGGSLFLWGRPDPDKRLVNWSLNITTTDPAIASLSASDIHSFNPVLGLPIPPETEPVRRWETVHEPGETPPLGGDSPENHLQGLSIVHGLGIGASNASLDPFYDPVHSAWLLARIEYALHGIAGQAEFYLQIGSRGIAHADESTSQTFVTLGATSDPPLNADTQRLAPNTTPGITPDAIVHVSQFSSSNADFDLDNRVTGRDLLIWQRGFLTTSSATHSEGDANFDQAIDESDLSVWQQQFGTTVATHALTIVPEPGSIFLAVLFCVVFSKARHGVLPVGSETTRK